MRVMLHKGLKTTGQAAKYISRHPKTLQARDRAGVLPARRTASGRRYWLRADLDRYLGRTAVERLRRTVGYCRVSSPAQRPDLKKQRRIVEEFAIAKGIANLEFIEEIGGGLNFQRPKFRPPPIRSEEHTSELQSRRDLVCRLLLEKKKKKRSQVIMDGEPGTREGHETV